MATMQAGDGDNGSRQLQRQKQATATTVAGDNKRGMSQEKHTKDEDNNSHNSKKSCRNGKNNGKSRQHQDKKMTMTSRSGMLEEKQHARRRVMIMSKKKTWL